MDLVIIDVLIAVGFFIMAVIFFKKAAEMKKKKDKDKNDTFDRK